MLGTAKKESPANRRNFIGGSDARIIMGQDEKALFPRSGPLPALAAPSPG
jgi:hypothetical protein